MHACWGIHTPNGRYCSDSCAPCFATTRMGRFACEPQRDKTMSSDDAWPPLPPVQTGLRCRCPRCGQGHLFNGFLTLCPSCEVCGLDYSFADPADGPAFFVICFACIPSVALAVWIEVAFSAPYWVHLFTTLPFMLLTCI